MRDLISRQAAIDALNDLITGATESCFEWIYKDDALEAVKQLPPAHSTNLAEVGTDCISRQALLDKFEPWLKVKDYNDGELNMLKTVLYEIRFMRSAEPKRGKWVDMGKDPATGKWDTRLHIYCSECGHRSDDKPTKYCPNCGAKMEVTK